MRCEGEDQQANRSYSDAVLIGAHTPVQAVDLHIWRVHARQLDSSSSARLWVLLLAQEPEPTKLPWADRELPVCVWRYEHALWRLPKLATALADPLGPAAREVDPHLRRYYYMHTSLLLWWEAAGHRVPSLRFIWRVEPDVLFSGPWPTLLRLANASDADLLLPGYKLERRFPAEFYHWQANANM